MAQATRTCGSLSVVKSMKRCTCTPVCRSSGKSRHSRLPQIVSREIADDEAGSSAAELNVGEVIQ